MIGQHAGQISTEEEDVGPVTLTHHVIVNENTDLRVDIVKEYLSKAQNASLKDIKKALIGFTPASDSELKDIIKAANPDTYEKLYPHFNEEQHVEKESLKRHLTLDEIIVLEELRDSNYTRRAKYEIFKQKCPNSTRKIQSISDYYFSHPTCPDWAKPHLNKQKKDPVKHVIQQNNKHADTHILTRTIKALYNAGYTSKTVTSVKPILNELIAQNSDYGEIELAIEYLKP